MAAGSRGQTPQTDAHPHLNVVLPSGAVHVVALNGEDVTVGKSSKNVVVVDDPAVSSTHALFRWNGREWLVVDLASRNGVFVNHHRIAGSCLVRAGDVVQIGHCSVSLATHSVARRRDRKPRSKPGRRAATKARKQRTNAKATYIKLSGALLAKVIGPVVTVLLGLLVSGHFLLSCDTGHKADTTPAPEQHVVGLHAAASATLRADLQQAFKRPRVARSRPIRPARAA